MIEEFRPAIEELESDYDSYEWDAEYYQYEGRGVSLTIVQDRDGHRVDGSNHTQPFIWLKCDTPSDDLPSNYIWDPCYECKSGMAHHCYNCGAKLASHMEAICLGCWDKTLHEIAISVACREAL